jgi:2-polyprenyl-3-methyl-5-hydroxy-6-metoxy-1,4-benzoquinol methylase
MLAYVPVSSRRILDVGCGRGVFGAALRKRAECEVWGVEPDAACIANANSNLNKVLHGCFSPGLDLPEKFFDGIVFNDVLEHLLDPLSALQYALTLLSDKGVVVASIPNIGHFPIVWKLAICGEWDYKERGILDETHLRFYTRSGIKKLFEQAGLEIQTIEGINDFYNMEPEDQKLWWRYRMVSWLPLAGIQDMRHLQFAVVAGKK